MGEAIFLRKYGNKHTFGGSTLISIPIEKFVSKVCKLSSKQINRQNKKRTNKKAKNHSTIHA